jgi:hypothetical protein
LASWNATVQKVTAATAAVLVAAKAIDEENARALVRNSQKQAALRKAARENAQHVLQHAQLLQAQEDLKMRQLVLLALQELPGRKKRKLLGDDKKSMKKIVTRIGKLNFTRPKGKKQTCCVYCKTLSMLAVKMIRIIFVVVQKST